MRIRSALAGLLLAGTLLPASASLVTLHTRQSTLAAPTLGANPANANYYRHNIDHLLDTGPTAGYCDATVASYADVSNHGACGGAVSDLAFKFVVDFGVTAAQGADFSLRVGPDFGKGGAVFLDGQLLGVKTSDMWWAGSWNAPTQIFQFLDLVLTQGAHELAVYGLEGCCDGGQRAEFRLGTGAWNVFAANDVLVLPAGGTQAAVVPEPSELALVLSALLGMAGATLLRRRQLRA